MGEFGCLRFVSDDRDELGAGWARRPRPYRVERDGVAVLIAGFWSGRSGRDVEG